MCRQLQSCEATCGADARHHISHFEHCVTSDLRCDHKTIFTAVTGASEEQFNQTADWCLHIEDHTNESAYADVEREVSCDWRRAGHVTQTILSSDWCRWLASTRSSPSRRTSSPSSSPSTSAAGATNSAGR